MLARVDTCCTPDPRGVGGGKRDVPPVDHTFDFHLPATADKCSVCLMNFAVFERVSCDNAVYVNQLAMLGHRGRSIDISFYGRFFNKVDCVIEQSKGFTQFCNPF